ncbi:MAG: DUF6607 family protein [Bacteriovoracaceae bacterium]
MKFFSFLIAIFLFLSSCAQTPIKKSSSWVFTRGLETKTRGGTTTGPEVEFDTKTPKSWKDLKEKGLSKKEKDRRAILSLAGEFQTKFEFLETFTIDPNKKKDPPYSSWGTELVKIIKNEKNFISLQHIMVMEFINPKTKKKEGPFVMKHWRQDWIWQGQNQLVYQGEGKFKLIQNSKKEMKGKWLWNVYQVDDSPRYSGTGSWDHRKALSIFTTHEMNRPLPRRERTLRSDYQILKGTEQLIVTPLAWYHEQKSFKKADAILSREVGHNSYRRIQNYPFQLGYDYWEKTQHYWQDVQNVWSKTIKSKKAFTLKSKVDKSFLFAKHFKQAEDEKFNQKTSKNRIKRISDMIKEHISSY